MRTKRVPENNIVNGTCFFLPPSSDSKNLLKQIEQIERLLHSLPRLLNPLAKDNFLYQQIKN